MLVTIWNGKTYNSILEAENALLALQKDYIYTLFYLIHSKSSKTDLDLDYLPFLDMVDNLSSTNRDIKKLSECKKWIQD